MVEIKFTSSKKQSTGNTGIWLIIALVISILMFVGGVSNSQEKHLSLWRPILGFILAVPLSFSGALIGDHLRKIAMPDVFFSSGMRETLKKRLFWAIGPQIIGIVAGQFIWGVILR